MSSASTPSSATRTSAIKAQGWRALSWATRSVRNHGLGTRFPVLHRLHSRLRRSLGVNLVQVRGHDFEVDPQDTLRIAAFGDYEPVETQWYLANVNPGDVVLEVGANIGYFTLLFANQVGASGHVHAYEPDPEIAAILRRNVERNGYQDIVTIREVAAGEHTETRALHSSDTNRGDNRFFETSEDSNHFNVEVVPLDTDLAGVDRRIDVFKMDIQGAEPLALAGMRGILKSRPPRKILMEFWPDGIREMKAEPESVIATLVDAGYRVGELTAAGVKPVDTGKLMTRFTPGDKTWVNLVCEHNES